MSAAVPLNPQATYRIMTYNMGGKVNHAPESIAILKRYLPDIMGLQECQAHIHEGVLAHLPEEYAYVDRYHAEGGYNYTPILYNKEKFTLIKSGLVWLRGRYLGTHTKSLNWAVFTDKNGVTFAHINVHCAVCVAKYKGFEDSTTEQRAAQALAWRLDNVAQILEVKEEILSTFGEIPVLVTGDHNFNCETAPYAKVIEAGFVDAEKVARVSTMPGYKTSYKYGTIPAEGISIDHVFAIGDVDLVLHAVVRDEDVYVASDHCPVYVEFNVK